MDSIDSLLNQAEQSSTPNQSKNVEDILSQAETDAVNSPAHQQARMLLGLPRIMQPGTGKDISQHEQQARDIITPNTTGSFLHGALMPFGHTPPAEVMQSHPTAATLGGISSIVGTSLPIGGPFTATTMGGKAALGALGGAAFTATPEYLKGMIQGKTQAQSLKDAVIPGIVGGGLGAMSPLFVSGLGKVATKFKTMAMNTPVMEHLIHKEFDKLEADTRVATLDAEKAWNETTRGFTPDSKLRIDNELRTPGSITNLTEAEQQAVNRYTTLIKPVQQFVKDQNLADVHYPNYVKNLYAGKSDEMFDYMRNMPGSRERKFMHPDEALKFRDEKVQEVKDKGFDPEVVKKMNPDELKNAGFDPRMPRWLSLNPIRDPGLSLAATIKSAYQTYNVRNFIHTMADMVDEKGNHLINNSGGPGYKKLEDSYGLFKKYLFAGASKQGEGRATFLREGDTYVLKQYAGTLEKLIDLHSPSATQEGLKEANRVLKSLTFYNPAWHFINLLSEGLKVMPGNVYRAFGLGADKVLKDESMMRRMVASGVLSEHVLAAKDAMYQAIKQASNQYRIPVLSQISDKLRSVQEKTLWTYASHLQANIWSSYRANFIKKGFTEPIAERMAAEVTNDAMGMVSKSRIPQLLQDPIFGKWIAFIPQWMTTKSRQLLGTVAPGMMFKSFTKDQQAALQKQYILHAMYGASQWMTMAALANKTLSGHWPWENSPGHKSPEYIETKWGYTVDNPFFKGLTMPYRMVKSMADMSPRFTGPVPRLLYGQATGKDLLTGRPFMGPGMTKEDQIAARGKQVLKDLNLFGTGNLIRESEKVQPNYGMAAAQMALPMYAMKDNPAGPVIQKILKMKSTDSPYHDVKYIPPWQVDIDRALLKKDIQTAQNIASKNMPNKDGDAINDYLNKRMMKYKAPITYTLQYVLKESERNKYINMLSDAERKKLFEAQASEQESLK